MIVEKLIHDNVMRVSRHFVIWLAKVVPKNQQEQERIDQNSDDKYSPHKRQFSASDCCMW